jgi:hypothetical protein
MAGTDRSGRLRVLDSEGRVCWVEVNMDPMRWALSTRFTSRHALSWAKIVGMGSDSGKG